MDAIEFLTKEHQKFKKHLSSIDDKSHKFETKLKMFDELGKDLIRHENMEHRVWYPHLKDDQRLDEKIRHLLKEEQHAEKAIKQLKSIKNQSEWEKKFSQFRSDVEHHAKEEENKLFIAVEKILNKSELEKIGEEMFKYKQTH